MLVPNPARDSAESVSEPSLTAGPPAEEAGCVLTVDLGALSDNWKLLRAMSSPAECAAVVKADAYGCGLEPVSAMLRQVGCTTFFVADLPEGKRLRKTVPDAVIYILAGLPPGTAPVFAEHNFRPVINSSVELAEWDAFTLTSKWDGSFALQVDTGMNRLGVTIDEAAAIAPRLNNQNHGLVLLMTHFVASQFPESSRNGEQMLAFRNIRALFRGVPASIANSSGIFLNSAAHLDLVRPGVALYGVNPTPNKSNPMKPVVELKARVAQVRDLEFGETVGYDATWTARRPTRIAVVSMGYADGIFRSVGGDDQKPGGTLFFGGKPCPIIGRISMDVLMLDVTHLPEGSVKRGDYATMIGAERDVDATAQMQGTIGYEVLTNFGQRFARVYRGG